MSEQIALPTPEVKSGITPLPYSPSWVDRLHMWVHRLPLRTWLFYMLIALLLVFGFAWVEWQTGQYPVGTLYPFHVLLFGASPYALALVHYLDCYAHRALTRFRPALIADAEREALLRYRLTTAPARPTMIATLVGFGLGALAFLIPIEWLSQTYKFANTPISAALYMFLYVLLWMVSSACLYHVFHQLRVIDIIYTQHMRVNLFRRRPLYAVAWLSAYTAIGFFVPSYGSIILSPRDSGTGALIQLASMLPAPLLAIVCFIWPLLGIHRLLEAEKVCLVDANQTLLEDTFQKIEACARTEQLDDIERLNKLMESLQTKDRILKQIFDVAVAA